MAQLIIPAGGAALGWWVGGSTGASVGWALGSMLSAQKEKDITMPSVGDLRVQTSGYGSMIPFINGKQRLAGNVVWTTDKTAHQTSSSTGGKGFGSSEETVTVTTYTISMAIVIGVGPILGIKRVWEDGLLKADSSTGQGRCPGKLYLGNNTQNPDPTMEAHEGVGNVPAYRGLAYMVLTDFNLGPTGRVPMFNFEVEKGEAM